MRSDLYNGVTLAFIGDAYYGLQIKRHLVEGRAVTHAQTLQKLLAQFVKAAAQATIIQTLIEQETLTEAEIDIFKRGRNAKTNSKPKHADVITYKMSTGFEAVIGWLVLDKNEARADELIEKAIAIIEGAGDLYEK